jgi:hypothetical protein
MIGSPDFDGILALVEERWEGTPRELSRELGYHGTWIWEAQRGNVRTKRCWPRWLKLQNFLEGYQLKKIG